MIHDAIESGQIAGIVATSDGHKGRPGASHPGRGHFGSYGGLTCVLVDELTRDQVWEAFQSRRHYATTGARTYLSVEGELRGGEGDVGETTGRPRAANTGDAVPADSRTTDADGRIVMGGQADRGGAATIRLAVRYAGTAPILDVDVFNGLERIDHRRGGDPAAGDRILVWWSGSHRRGRGRHVDWSGFCELDGNELTDVRPVNFHNPDRPLRQISGSRLEWESITTGGMSGFVGRLSSPSSGSLRIETERLSHVLDLSKLGDEEVSIDAGGVDARLRVMRLPSGNEALEVSFEADYELHRDTRNAVYVRITQEDGTMTWSSPIYVG